METRGLTDNSNQPWGGWTLENDPTVHGEVISPILSDTLDS